MTSAEHLAHRKNTVISILLACTGYAYYNIGDAAVKMMAVKFHFSQFFLLNSLFILVFMAVYGWLKDGKSAFRTKNPGWMFLRAAIAQVLAICNITAFPHVHLTTFYTLIFTSPFLVAVLASLFLGDKLDKRRLFLILMGFSVILFIFRPGGGLFNVWGLLVLVSAFFYSLQMVIVRHLGKGESRTFMSMWGCTLSILISLPFLHSHFIWPTSYEWGVFVLMSLTGGIGFLCVTYAFQHAPSAAVVAPYHYTQIVWGALLGYFLFKEIPNGDTIIGAILIILLGIYLLYDETHRRPVVKIEEI